MLVLKLDEVLEPSLKVQDAVLIVSTKVSSMDKPVFAEEGLGLLGPVEIAHHLRAALGHNLTDLAHVAEVASLRIHNLDRGACGNCTNIPGSREKV